jgi:hypothetical protein
VLTWRRNHLLRLFLALTCGLVALATSASAVVSVSVSPSSVSLAPGNRQQQFTAQVSGSANTTVTWRVSGAGCGGSSCGVITAAGLYTAPTSIPIPNIVTVTATSNADPTKSASAQVTLITGLEISISPTSKQLVTGTQQQFTATVTGSNSFGVNWSISGDGCSGSACGTIDGTGLYTAPAAVPNPPTVTVTATAQADATKSASATVTVLSPVAVSVSPSSAKVKTGTTQVFTAKVTGTANTAVTWSVSGAGCNGAACGTITSAGLYTAPTSVPKPATVTVTATSQADATKSASATVTIVLAVAVSVSPSSVNVVSGAQQQFTVTVTGTANKAVTWTISGAGCSGATCGTISNSGLYTAPSTIPNPPTVTVTVTSQADTTKSAMATVTVVSGVAISVSPTSAKLLIGAQKQFTATVIGTVNLTVTWTISGAGCSGSTCGTITSAGLYTAPASVPTPPTVTVTATSQADPSKSASATVTILLPVAVSVSPSSAKVVTGAKQQFTATVTGTINTTVTWTISGTGCSGPTCGTITVAGLYTAPASVPTPPTVTVTATSQADPSKSASATVTVLPPVAVSVSPSSAKVVIGAKQQFTASVTGTTNTAVKWSLSGAGCSGPTCGTITVAGLYTAPATIPNPPTVIVTATSEANPSKSATAIVTVEARGLIDVLPSNALVTAGGQLQFSAQDGGALAASGSSALAVTWKLSGTGCVGSQCGVITSTGLFTAPAVPPVPATILVTAVSGAKSGSATVTIVPSNQSKLLGQYVFLFRGFDSSGVYQAAGSFTADGSGNVLNGLEDVNRLSGPITNLPFTGTYTISADNRGTITITTASGSSTFTFSLNPSGDRARFIEFDNSGIRGSGVIKAQTLAKFSDSSFSGSYALSLSGADFASGRIAGLGAIFADGSGTIAGSTLDVNDAGSALAPVNNFPGAYTIAANGRGTASLRVPLLGGATFHFSVYVVSSHEAFWLSTDPVGASSPMLSGDALQQSSSPFSESSLQGSSVFTQSGLANGSADVAIGQLSFDGTGAISGQLDENNGGAITTAAVLAGSYTTQSNGRALLNLINVKTQAVTSFVAYLIAPNSAFLLSMEPAVKIGALQPQVVAPPFSNGVAAGTFTLAPDAVANSSAAVATGVITLDGKDGQAGLVGTEDSSQTSGLSPDLHVAGTYSVSSVSNNGRGVANLTSPGPQMISFWMVSFSEFVGVDIDAGYSEPTELIFEQ